MRSIRDTLLLSGACFLAFTTTGGPATAQRVILEEDFEAHSVGDFPESWEDAAAIERRCALASVEIARVSDPDGVATQALRTKAQVCARSQGVYRRIGIHENVSISLDVQIEQYSGARAPRGNDYPVYIGLADIEGCVDPAFSRTIGIWASPLTQTWLLWDARGATCANPNANADGRDLDLGIPAIEGHWYRFEILFDADVGLFECSITNLSTGEDYPPEEMFVDMHGRHLGGFPHLLISDLESSGVAPAGLALVDNILVVDESSPPPPPPVEFVRGDSNGDGQVQGITDSVFLLEFQFLGGAEPPCRAAGDVDGDGAINVSDAVYLLNHFFLGAAAPVAPFPNCGPGIGALGCDTPPVDCR